jgi:hypothetical protein
MSTNLSGTRLDIFSGRGKLLGMTDSKPTGTPEMPEAAREWMRAIASKRTPAKAEASRRNIARANEARRRDPETLLCLCGGCPDNPKWTCPRGRLLKQREQAAKKRAAAQAEGTP